MDITKRLLYISATLIAIAVALEIFVFVNLTLLKCNQPKWSIPPNVTVEYPDRVCYMWQIPTTNNPRDQYVYCEDRDEQ